MKFLFPVAAIFLFAGCVTQSKLTAIGSRNADGLPVGDFQVVTAAGSKQAQGRFQDGKMDGSWGFFDSRQVRVAEISYVRGVASGSYRTYFGSVHNPAAAGKLMSEGQVQRGVIMGKHITYAPDGGIFSSAMFDGGEIRNLEIGSSEAARQTADADIRFIRTLEAIVIESIK